MNLEPFPLDPATALWDQKPAPRFLPLGERAWCASCLPLLLAQAYCERISLWAACLGSGACAVSSRGKRKRGWLWFCLMQYVLLPSGTQCANDPGPGLLRAGPLQGRAVYTASHGAHISSLPSGDRCANPASVSGRGGLQRALFSVFSAWKHSGAEKLFTPLRVSRAARSAVPCRSSASGHWASRSKYTRGQSWRTVPLVGHLAVCEPLPSVSYWVLPEQTLVLSV